MNKSIKFKKVYFIGAGSTASLGLLSTEQQDKYIAGICFKDEKLVCLNEKDKLPEADLDLLKSFSKDFFSKENLTVNLLFNLCDSRLKNRLGLCGKTQTYEEKDLMRIKRTIKALIFANFAVKLNKEGKSDERIKGFYKKLAKDALQEKIGMSQNGANVQGREFIFTNYAVINLNWDLMSIIPMLQAHQELNNENDYYTSINNKSTKIKIFNDFASFMACRKTDENTDVWYPYNESVAIRVNDFEYEPKRIVTLVKTYYPHGLMNLYRCRWCGKHTMDIGNISIEPLVKNKYYSNKQIMKCPHCDGYINALDIEYLEQTNHKIINPYLEEISIDMKDALFNTEEIIFIGYSLPQDDIDYNEIFIGSASSVEKVKVVLYDEKYEKDNNFYPKTYYKDINGDRQATMNNFIRIFGEEKVLFNMSGAPNCFSCDDLYN